MSSSAYAENRKTTPRVCKGYDLENLKPRIRTGETSMPHSFVRQCATMGGSILCLARALLAAPFGPSAMCFLRTSQCFGWHGPNIRHNQLGTAFRRRSSARINLSFHPLRKVFAVHDFADHNPLLALARSRRPCPSLFLSLRPSPHARQRQLQLPLGNHVQHAGGQRLVGQPGFLCPRP